MNIFYKNVSVALLITGLAGCFSEGKTDQGSDFSTKSDSLSLTIDGTDYTLDHQQTCNMFGPTIGIIFSQQADFVENPGVLLHIVGYKAEEGTEGMVNITFGNIKYNYEGPLSYASDTLSWEGKLDQYDINVSQHKPIGQVPARFSVKCG